MVSYDLMKSWWLRNLEYKHSMRHDSKNTPPPKLDTTHFSIFSSLSKILSVVCTYPFQLVRARLQDQHQSYRNLSDVIKKTYKNEKVYGFYKGLIPCLIRVTPAASVTFIVYENLLLFLENRY
jgi:solute carrier family 25 folate transporter 32